MDSNLNFQSLILKLQQFWHDQGCLLWQPYNTQVGAGTYNPATVLRVLGPEPWNVAYVEPSVRPDDGRYGENPYRLQTHYQFQVILKPDPGNAQEIYLKSLEAIGIDPLQHDIRFVEDNWESPALGAWGLGWEVWLDGQEITQFTYFQQAGGMPTNPVSVEITYGLERIAMPLQRVNHFTKIQWSPDRTYGDVNLAAEQEHSKYYFEDADIDSLRQMYDLYEKEAERALAKDLVLPAHDYVLKCSHTFNILDTRGAVGVTERQDLFKRMRDLSRKVALAYVAQRENLSFPWSTGSVQSTLKDAVKPALPQTLETGKEMPDKADFVFEIGTEELPAADQKMALEQLESLTTAMLEEVRLPYEKLHIYGTPRRLVVYVKGLAGRQADLSKIVKGPPAERAFDKDGSPTKAAIGFARGKGIDVSELKVMEIDGGSYAAATVFEAGKSAVEVLSEKLADLIKNIRFNKSMRWNPSGVSFSRPIRWLFAMFDGFVIPFEYAGLISSDQTRGLRFHEPEERQLAGPQEYFDFLKSQGVVLEPQERREVIKRQVQALMAEVNGDTDLDEGLLEEVTFLVEAPTALRGSFAEEHLQLPDAVLVSVMKKHQRYFPVRSAADGKLMPYFITIRNGDGAYKEIVTNGNEIVIKARFEDAAFFIAEDSKKKLEEYLPKLETLTFQFKLGSMLDKTKRIEKLVTKLAPIFELDADELKTTERAAHLCKADLVTHMVVEMTSLQGLVGRFYALKSGEEASVAGAIAEHYLPASAGDKLPKAKPGLLVGLADRLDSLAGLFSAGLAPTGTKDPFAQRRMALGLVINLTAWDQDVDLRQALKMAAETLPFETNQSALDECLDFIVGRKRSYFMEQLGYAYDVVDAVLAEQKHNPAGALRAVKELTEWVKREDWNQILPAYSRCVRITREIKEQYALTSAVLEEAAEKELYAALEKVLGQDIRKGSAEEFFAVFTPLIPQINKFFDEVLVMAEDEAVRKNRLALLQKIAALAKGVADFSCLEGF